jgi:hypothetical protein
VLLIIVGTVVVIAFLVGLIVAAEVERRNAARAVWRK